MYCASDNKTIPGVSSSQSSKNVKDVQNRIKLFSHRFAQVCAQTQVHSQFLHSHSPMGQHSANGEIHYMYNVHSEPTVL
ncbi:hypothetical protein ABMA27_004236 [Loxostege sticticalis]|uniref:Uncharacterized protein n=1 Tax=Loxostege sticticalis TaxID=481309 RepID=A0ABR3HMU1_LOXSC